MVQNPGEAPEPQIIRIGGARAGATHDAGAAPATRATRIADRRPRFSRRRALVAVAAAVAVLFGAFGVHTFVDQRKERAQTRADAELAAAGVAAASAVARLDLAAVPGLTVGERGCLSSACGTSIDAPERATAVVGSALTNLGFAASEPTCERGRRTEVTCSVPLTFGGVDVGVVRAVRDETLYTAFGKQTRVSVDVAGPASSVVSLPQPATPMPTDPRSSTALPRDLLRAATCTEPVEGGCLAFAVDTVIEAEPGATWTRVGRFVTDAGWEARGECPRGPLNSCSFSAHRRTAEGNVSVVATFRPAGPRLEVKAEIRSTAF